MDDIPEIEQRNVEAKRRNAAIMAGISLGADSIYTPSTHLSVKPVPVERAPKRHGSKWENVEPTRKSQRVMGTSPVFKDLSSLKMDERDENSKAQPIRKMVPGSRVRKRGPMDSGLGIRVKYGIVYDSWNGTLCHQCRQKTVVEKLKCRREDCGRWFDRGCIEGRYADSADQIARDDWWCPCCQGTCSCSFCRIDLGLPTAGRIKTSLTEDGQKVSFSEIIGDIEFNADRTGWWPKYPNRFGLVPVGQERVYDDQGRWWTGGKEE